MRRSEMDPFSPPQKCMDRYVAVARLSAALAVAGFVGTSYAQAQAASPPTQAHSAAAGLKWGPAPAVFPKGAKMAVVSGDPSQAEPFVVQLIFPPRYRIPPHFHPTDENVKVKQGTLLFGMGDRMDLSQVKRMTKGDSGSVAANMHHFAAAVGRTVVQVSAMGPFAMTYVNAADDPQTVSSTAGIKGHGKGRSKVHDKP